jgi:hypothetical protein
LVFVYTAPKVLIAERVPPRYDPGPAVIYTARRLLAAGTEIRLYTTGDTYGVYVEDEDLIPSARETVLQSGFNAPAVRDHDDETYAVALGTIGAGQSVDHVVWDLGSVADRVVVAKLYTASTLCYARVVVSSDGASWGDAVTCVGATCLGAWRGLFRYVKLTSTNAGASVVSGDLFRYYTLEVYPANLRKVLVSTEDTYKLVRVVASGGSQLIELMRVV